MSQFFLAMGMAVSANIVYHLCAKLIDSKTNPLVSLMAAYATATLICLVVSPFFTSHPLKELRSINCVPIIFGASLVILELGFILAYRSGWKINSAAIFCNVAVGLLLIPIGFFFFKEHLSLTKTVGILFSLLGLFLLGIK